MKLSLLACEGVLCTIALLACSDSSRSNGNFVPAEAGVPDGSPSLPPEDAGIPADAGADGAFEAGGPRACSLDGFCPGTLPTPGLMLRDVWSDGQGVAWTVTEEGKILRWDGAAWAVNHAGLGPLYAIWGSGATDLWAGGAAGLLHGAGATSATIVWTPVASLPGDATVPILSVWGTSGDDVWAVGGATIVSYDEGYAAFAFRGRLLHLTGGGWELDASAPASTSFQKVWGTSPSDAWIVARQTDKATTVLHRASSSGPWSDESPGDSCAPMFGWRNDSDVPHELHSVVIGGNSTNVFVIGLGWNDLYEARVQSCSHRRSDLGADWTHTDIAPCENAGASFPRAVERMAVWSPEPNDIWVAGQFGRLNRWNGATWSTVRISVTDLPLTNDLHGIFARPGVELWVVGKDIAMRKALP